MKHEQLLLDTFEDIQGIQNQKVKMSILKQVQHKQLYSIQQYK